MNTDWLHEGYSKHLIERLARIPEDAWVHFEIAAESENNNGKLSAGCAVKMATYLDADTIRDFIEFCDDSSTPSLYDLYNVSKMIRDALFEPSPTQSPDPVNAFKRKTPAPTQH